MPLIIIHYKPSLCTTTNSRSNKSLTPQIIRNQTHVKIKSKIHSCQLRPTTKSNPKNVFSIFFLHFFPTQTHEKSNPITVVHPDPPLMQILQLLPKVTSTNKRIFGSAFRKKVRNPQTSCRTEINKLNSLSQHSHETQRDTVFGKHGVSYGTSSHYNPYMYNCKGTPFHVNFLKNYQKSI